MKLGRHTFYHRAVMKAVCTANPPTVLLTHIERIRISELCGNIFFRMTCIYTRKPALHMFSAAKNGLSADLDIKPQSAFAEIMGRTFSAVIRFDRQNIFARTHYRRYIECFVNFVMRIIRILPESPQNAIQIQHEIGVARNIYLNIISLVYMKRRFKLCVFVLFIARIFPNPYTIHNIFHIKINGFPYNRTVGKTRTFRHPRNKKHTENFHLPNQFRAHSIRCNAAPQTDFRKCF